MNEPTSEQPTHRTELPDFKPKGMSTLDRCLAWLMAFIVVITMIAFAAKYVDSHTANNAPAAKATSTATAKPNSSTVAPITMYVVVNTNNDYVWWLDEYGSRFTSSTANAFIKGHPSYKVFALRLN